MGFGLTFENFYLAFSLLSFALASENIGFIFTAPRTFLSSHDENVCITFKNQTESVEVNVVIVDEREANVIASTVQEITPDDYGGKCFKISMPRTKIKNGRLHLTIHSKAEEDFKINYMEQISIQTNPDMTFIQTDKPVYNSGHLVRFRIFILRSDLTPILEPVDKIWIENPNGVRLVQWLNEANNQGFITKTFQLSKEPLPGKWNIKVQRKNEEVVSHSFLVENYILPKFAVQIRAPEYFDSISGNITVCAKYLFGKPVQGKVLLEHFIKCTFSYYCQETGSSASESHALNSDGCINYHINLHNLSNFARSLMVNATVFEDGTNTKAKASSQITIKNSKRKSRPKFSIHTKHRKFKPGLPFKGQVVIKDQPIVDRVVLICLDVNEEKHCKEVLIRNNVADFVILPVNIKNEKNFKAFLEIKDLRETSQHTTKLNLVPWYSPSGSYLLLEDATNEPVLCGPRAKLRVLYTTSDSPLSLQFHYMVKARGDIISKGLLNQFSLKSKPSVNWKHSNILNRGNVENIMEFEFTIEVTAFMSPHSYLIVYFIGTNGEVVADGLTLNTEKCLDNKVFTSWKENSVFPGSRNNFYIETSPNSLCALTVTDKSAKLVTKQNDFNKEKLFKAIEKFEITSFTPETSVNHCKSNSDYPDGDTKKNETDFLSHPPESDSIFVDSSEAFDNFGALVITDLNLETRPCKEKPNGENLSSKTRNSDVFYDYGIENTSLFDVEDFPDEIFQETISPNSRESKASYELRNFFPETWIWDLIPINNSGKADISVQVPHTLTEWTAETVCLDLVKGLGVSETSALVTYQPFFLDFAVPHSVKQKEVLHLPVSVFNYHPTDLPIKITLSPLKSFISRSEESHSYCIRTKSKVVHRFVLESVKLGEAEIKVKAEIDTGFNGDCGPVLTKNSDIVVKKTTVKHRGFPMEEVKSGFICGNNSGFDHEVQWSIKVPQDVVESSIEVKALVSGDILGPSLKNINNLIKLPTGCGEQNMMLLVPNILLLDYLLLTKSEELKIIEKALKNLDLGYQRQLNYRHSDGSYSAFGEQDEKGSIWLTAFVIRYLSQARKYTYVDETDLSASITWVMKQQLENGCFPVIGKIYHRQLKEKETEEESSKTLTAYILISLLEAGIPLSDPVIKNAIFCLKPDEESLGTYGDLLSSYALIMAGQFRDSQALMMEMLREAKRSYGMLWWENNDSLESSIEMTSYGILALVKLGGPLFMAAASDAVRWIIQYQNQNGGFISSQDTVLALEAISKFSATLPRVSEQDHLSVKIDAKYGVHNINISDKNRLVQQEVELPPYSPLVHFDSSGTGCALVQALVRYNSRQAKSNEYFRIHISINSISEVDSYSISKFQICVRYKSPKEKINMAVLEVSMVSGYYPDRSSLYEIPTSRKGLRRWEEYEDKINFYFEDLKNKKVCVNFRVVQEVFIDNAGPGLIKLYDYYNTNHHTTVKYNLIKGWQNTAPKGRTLFESRRESKRDLNKYQISSRPFGNIDGSLQIPKEGEVQPVFALPPKSEFRNERNFNPQVRAKHNIRRTQNNDGSVYTLYGLPPQSKLESGRKYQDHLQHFVDMDHDLETPKGGGIYPVYALPPQSNTRGAYCPHCLNTVPDIFSKLYCTSKIAVKVLILSKDTLEFQMDVSPNKNFYSVRKKVSFTIKENCDCPILNSVNSYALLVVTPPKSFRVEHIQELHIDDSVQLYSWGNTDEMLRYLEDLKKNCETLLYFQ